MELEPVDVTDIENIPPRTATPDRFKQLSQCLLWLNEPHTARFFAIHLLCLIIACARISRNLHPSLFTRHKQIIRQYLLFFIRLNRKRELLPTGNHRKTLRNTAL